MVWSYDDVPDQTGRTVMVTGANTGIGYQTARALAGRGAHVVLACRNERKGRDAISGVMKDQPSGSVSYLRLDLADLASVAECASRFAERHDTLDLLINNAGVMMPPESRTEQGFELQIGVNHLGHFALTGHLLPQLQAASAPRVVNVSSIAHRQGTIRFDDLHSQRGYSPTRAYCQSKLANLLFAHELQRRHRDTLTSVSAHPGGTRTELKRHQNWLSIFTPLMMWPEEGCLPTLRAATDPDVEGDDYFGPSGWFEMRGPPTRAYRAPRSTDAETARRLWELSVEATGVRY